MATPTDKSIPDTKNPTDPATEKEHGEGGGMEEEGEGEGAQSAGGRAGETAK